MKGKIAILAMAIAMLTTGTAYARDQIRIVGSSTVYPFSTLVSENFGQTSGFKTPVVESTGSGGGFKLFCQGVGVDTPDISNASRAIKPSEIKTCADNGVTKITEVIIGYDGIVLAQSRDAVPFKLTLRDIYLALAKFIPDGKGGLMPNNNKTWKDVRDDLPNEKIEVLGPPPTSGTRDAFAELAMEGGAKTFPALAELKKTDEKKFLAASQGLREDGAYIEAGENDMLIVRKLEDNPNAVGIFGFSYLDQNADRIKGIEINGEVPTFDDIANGSYVLSRPLFFYVKDAHVGMISGIKEYMDLFVRMSDVDGRLSDKGLIPLPENQRKTMVHPLEK
jgi:phosphate transport system substrate-binding protein